MQPSNQSTDSFHRKVNINPGENFQTAPAASILSRPKRRDLFGTGLADVLLSLLVMLPFFAASTIVVQDRTNSIQVERTDRWRFELTPSDETLLSLREWGSATPGIGSFAIVSEGIANSCFVTRGTSRWVPPSLHGSFGAIGSRTSYRAK